MRTLPAPVYALSPDGRTAVGLDFLRTGRLRRGYGYAGDDPTAGQTAPETSGIYRLDLATEQVEPLFSLAQIAAVASPNYDGQAVENWVNHLLFSPDGSRFVFLHRWVLGNTAGPATRMFTAAPDGSDLRIMTDAGMSHFIWRDAGHIHGWARLTRDGPWAHYLFEEATGRAERLGNPARLTANGHMTYLPGGRWILNDFDLGRAAGKRRIELYLYDVAAERRVALAEVAHGASFAADRRCDLHPRSSRDGRLACFDSAHEGARQMYLADVGPIVG
jgi:Tol biopolymer transport system component